MRYYTKKKNSIESIAVTKIENGIQSIEKGIRSGSEVGSSLEFFFNKLKEINNSLYEELFTKYCIARLKSVADKKTCIHSV